MKAIRCSLLSLKLSLLLFIPVITCLTTLAERYLTANGAMNLKHHPFILQIINSLFYIILGGVFVLIFKYKSKARKHRYLLTEIESRTTVFSFRLLTKNEAPPRMIKLSVICLIFLKVVLLSIVLTFIHVQIAKYLVDLEFSSKFTILQIIFNGLISIPILKYSLHKHHYSSISLICISFVLVSLQCFPNVSGYLSYVYILTHSLIWAVIETNAKWIMRNNNINPYLLLFLYGLMGLTLHLVVSIPFSFIKCRWDFCDEGRLERYLESFKTIFSSVPLALCLLAYCFCFSVYMMLTLIVNNAFNSTHSCTAESLENVVWWIETVCNEGLDKSVYYDALSLIGYVTLFIGGMMYNELLIFNMCSLEVSTKEEIGKKAIEDLHMSVESIDRLL